MTDDQQVDFRAWAALGLCFIATVIIFLPYVGYSTQVTSMMADLSMDYTMVGALASATALSGGIVVYTAGGLFNRWGIKNICIAGLVLSALGQCFFSIASTYQTMLAARIFQGAAIPLLFVGPYTIAMHWAEHSKRLGVFMGVMLSTDGIGTMLVGYAYSHVLEFRGWRIGSLWGAAALLIIAGLVWLLLQEPESAASVDPSVRTDKPSQLVQYLSVLRQTNVRVAALFLTGVWGTYSVAIYWVPTLLIEEGHWSEATAGFAGALYPFAGVVSAVTFGLLSDRLGHRKPLMLISGIGMVLSFMGAAMAVAQHRYDVLAMTLPLGGLFAYGGLPLAYCLATDAVGLELAGMATGCIMGTGLICGGVIYPLVLGYVRDSTGLYTLGFVSAGGSLLMFNFIAVLFGRDVVSSSHGAEHGAPARSATWSARFLDLELRKGRVLNGNFSSYRCRLRHWRWRGQEARRTRGLHRLGRPK